MNLNKLKNKIHAANSKWWTDINTGKPIQRNMGQLLMLVVTELAEAVEGIRKNLPDDKLPHRSMEEVEMADAYIRLLDFAGGFKLHLYEVKDVFNYECHEDKAEEILFIVENVCKAWNSTSSVSLVLALIERYCKHHKLDLHGAVQEKVKFNKTRADHKIEHRRSKHGKKF